MRSLRLLDLAKPCFIQCQMWRFGWHVRSMAISPWGDDSREVKRWGFTGSQWKKLHRRLRLHGVRLPKIWIMDPNKNYHMLGNIKQMKEYNMTYDQQRMAMLEGVFLFTKDPSQIDQNRMFIMKAFNITEERINEIMATKPDMFDLKFSTKVAPFMAKVKDLGYSQQNVQQLVQNHPLVMTYPIRTIRMITQRYRGLGLTHTQIVEMASKAHHMMDTAFDTKIEKLLRWFTIFLKADMVRLAPHPDVFLFTIARLKESFWWLHDTAGIPKEHIRKMANRCPMMLTQSYIHLRIKLSFVKDHLGQDQYAVVKFPYFFVWSFTRISSRVGYLDHKKLDFKAHPLHHLFCEDDQEFIQRIKGTDLEEYKNFEAWWMERTEVEKLDALQFREYKINEPSGDLCGVYSSLPSQSSTVPS